MGAWWDRALLLLRRGPARSSALSRGSRGRPLLSGGKILAEAQRPSVASHNSRARTRFLVLWSWMDTRHFLKLIFPQYADRTVTVARPGGSEPGFDIALRRSAVTVVLSDPVVSLCSFRASRIPTSLQPRATLEARGSPSRPPAAGPRTPRRLHARARRPAWLQRLLPVCRDARSPASECLPHHLGGVTRQWRPRHRQAQGILPVVAALPCGPGSSLLNAQAGLPAGFAGYAACPTQSEHCHGGTAGVQGLSVPRLKLELDFQGAVLRGDRTREVRGHRSTRVPREGSAVRAGLPGRLHSCRPNT